MASGFAVWCNTLAQLHTYVSVYYLYTYVHVHVHACTYCIAKCNVYIGNEHWISSHFHDNFMLFSWLEAMEIII